MGISGADPNPQYYYDHREDLALFMDEAFHEKRIESLRNAYKQLHSDTVLYAGPAVIEVFGAAPFSPQDSPCAPRFSDAQKKLRTDFEIRSADLYSEAVIAKDRSFTVIDFPLPSIAGTREGFEEIFDSILSINTLDNALFQKIQGKMVDALSAASHIEVRGGNGNRTALTVRLQQPADPDTEASFENCTAKELQTLVVKDGKRVAPPTPLTEIQAYVKKQLKEEIWEEEQRFENPHRHYLDMSPSYYELKMDLLSEAKKK